MLDKKSKLILDYLSNNLSSNKGFINSHSISKDLDIPNEYVCKALKYLDEKGYLKIIPLDDPDTELVNCLTHLGLNYKEFEANSEPNIEQNFNIEKVTNSAFGNNGFTNLNNGVSFDELQDIINKQNIPVADKNQLTELTTYMKMLVENNTPMSKGALSKFGDLLAKHSWAATLIGNILVKHFMN